MGLPLSTEEKELTKEFLQELRNNHVERFPFATKEYSRALRKIKENYREAIPKPLNMLLIPDHPFRNFPRMEVAIQIYQGRDLYIPLPNCNEVVLRQYYKKVKNPLAIEFADMFIEELNL